MIPALNRVAKVETSTAFVIPTGTTGQRPIAPVLRMVLLDLIAELISMKVIVKQMLSGLLLVVLET